MGPEIMWYGTALINEICKYNWELYQDMLFLGTQG
jgi:hypothetical protein